MPEHVEEVVLRVAPAAKPVPGRVRAHQPRHAAPNDAKNGEGAAEANRRRVPPDPWLRDRVMLYHTNGMGKRRRRREGHSKGGRVVTGVHKIAVATRPANNTTTTAKGHRMLGVRQSNASPATRVQGSRAPPYVPVNPRSPCRTARYRPHVVVDSRLVAKTLSRLKNLVSRVRWNRVEPIVVMSWSAAIPYCRCGVVVAEENAGNGTERKQQRTSEKDEGDDDNRQPVKTNKAMVLRRTDNTHLLLTELVRERISVLCFGMCLNNRVLKHNIDIVLEAHHFACPCRVTCPKRSQYCERGGCSCPYAAMKTTNIDNAVRAGLSIVAG